MKNLKIQLDELIKKMEKKVLHETRWDTWMAGGWNSKNKENKKNKTKT